MPRKRLALASMLVLTLTLTLAGCSASEPMTDSREILGTVVSTTIYPDSSADASQTAELLGGSYARMAATESVLDAYLNDIWNERRLESSYRDEPPLRARAVLDFNTSPYYWRIIPLEVELILGRINNLGVAEYFSPSLYEVTALYDLEGAGSVPDPELLAYYTACADTFDYRSAVGGMEASFAHLDIEPPANLPEDSPYRVQRAGIDLGGAAKGYALDLALRELESSDKVVAALITAGSTTATIGDKPGDEPWRIGVEHPRDTDALVATVEAKGSITVSTSGDYQRYFERDGVRYHHILDPTTGLPARGLQSLTVVGASSGVNSDILSTALFVMGPEKAIAYAEENDLGLVLVDDEGQVQIVPGPEDRLWEIIEE